MADETDTKTTTTKKPATKPRAEKHTGQQEAEAGHRSSTAGLTRPDSEDTRMEVANGIVRVDH